MKTDIRAEIKKLCKDHIERCREHNAVDPEPYRQREDMNRYLAYQDKGGWSIPFILSDFVVSKQALLDRERYNQELEQYYASIGEPLNMSPTFLVGINTTLGRRNVVREKMTIFCNSLQNNKTNVLPISLERTVSLVFNKYHTFQIVIILIENMFRECAKRIRFSGKAVEHLMQIVRAEHQFWCGEVASLEENAKTLMQSVQKTPDKCFNKIGSEFVSPMPYGKGYYEAFAAFCISLTSKPQNHDEIENAAATLMLRALEGYNYDVSETLVIKYYDIIAQMLAGKCDQLKEFYSEFPVLAKFLESIADKYRS